MDNRKNNGGKRENAGRKSKAEELGLADLIDSVWTVANQKKVLKKLSEDCSSTDFHVRHESRKLLLAYKFGKPKDSVELTGKNGKPIEFARVRVIKPKSDDT